MDTLGGEFPSPFALLAVIAITILIAYRRGERNAEPWRDHGGGAGDGD